MSYTRHKYDLFISYARVDNRAVNKGDEGWVTQFEKHLDVELTALIGDSGVLKIWRDRELESNQVFDKTIRETIDDAAVFLALTSPGYLSSDYCKQELDWFAEPPHGSAGDLLVGDRMRIFNVLLRNVPYADWPKHYGGTSGSPFHDAERDEDLGFPSIPGQPLFRNQLRKLVIEIYNTLKAIKQQAGQIGGDVFSPTAAPSSLKTTGKSRVFLANTTDALSSLRSRIEKELQEKEVEVCGRVPPPHDGASHEAAVIDAMSGATLSVHLLNELPGTEIYDALGTFYPQKQAELGLKHARSQVIWVPQGLDIKTVEVASYQTFVDGLENGSREKAAYRFLREVPGVITHEILEQIEQLRAPVTVSSSSGVLLNTHFKDQPYTYDLTRFFHDRGVKYMICPELDDPRSNMKVFVEMLKQTATLIIVFGEVAEEWVRERLAAALQTVITEQCPLKSLGIYLAPPKKKDAGLHFNQGFFRVHMMDNSESFDPNTLEPLMV
jgi:hypothetical protein